MRFNFLLNASCLQTLFFNLSTLTLLGPNGIQGKIPMRMNKAEIAKLQASADALKAVIAQIEL